MLSTEVDAGVGAGEQSSVVEKDFARKLLSTVVRPDQARFQSTMLKAGAGRSGSNNNGGHDRTVAPATARAGPSDGGAEMEELSRLQEQNRPILEVYIKMHPLTLRFNNPSVERDFQNYFQAKRRFAVMFTFASVTFLMQWITLEEWVSTGSFNAPQFWTVQAVTVVSVLKLVALRSELPVQATAPSSSKGAQGEGERSGARHSAGSGRTSTATTAFTLSDDSKSRVALAQALQSRLPRHDLVLLVCVFTMCVTYLVHQAQDYSSLEDVGFLFAVVFITVVTSRMPYLWALALEVLVFASFQAVEQSPVSTNSISLFMCIVCFTYSLRLSEMALRRDFRLTRRLAAENIDVKVDVSTRAWFEFGQSKVAPSAADGTGAGGAGSAGQQAAKASHMIKGSDLVLGKVLGNGSFGTVVAGKWRGTEVAVKRIHGTNMQQAIVDFGSESALLASLRHPHIVMYLGTCIKPLMMVMELMPRGSLFQIMHTEHVPLDESLKLRILVDIAKGMNFLHLLEQPIIHNDLKSLNVLVDKEWRCKVSDFGLSKMKQLVKSSNGGGINGSNSGGTGGAPEVVVHSGDPPGAGSLEAAPDLAQVATVGWASPEALQSAPLTEKTDVYSFGVVMFEVLFGEVPFASVSKDAMALSVLTGKRPTDFVDAESFFAHVTGPKRRSAMQALEGAMRKAWEHDAHKRPSFSDLLAEFEHSVVDLYFGDDCKDWHDEIVIPQRSNKAAGPAEAAAAQPAFSINPDDLQLGPKIGSGAYGDVFEAVYHGTHVAVKQILNSNLSSDTIREFHKECTLMMQMRHPNIVLFMGSWAQPPKLVIVTELLTRGSLYFCYNSSPRRDALEDHLKMLYKVSEGMALGLNYLHNHDPPIIHRDMKSPNVLLDDHFGAKIADFGLSRIKEEGKVMTSVGSPLWAAPEVLRGEESGFPSDVYSWAIVVWELLQWSEPYVGLSPSVIMRQVAFNGLRPECPATCPPPLKKLLEDCWHSEPDKRPKFDAIIRTIDEWNDSP